MIQDYNHSKEFYNGHVIEKRINETAIRLDGSITTFLTVQQAKDHVDGMNEAKKRRRIIVNTINTVPNF